MPDFEGLPAGVKIPRRRGVLVEAYDGGPLDERARKAWRDAKAVRCQALCGFEKLSPSELPEPLVRRLIKRDDARNADG